MDRYQKRYLEHQKKKKQQLVSIMKSRVSQRSFNGVEVPGIMVDFILSTAALSPSSCNRQAVYVVPVSERNEKEILGGVLVGGVGWAHRADKILLVFAAKEAYKAGNEVRFMPYLDGGVSIYAMMLAGEAVGVGMAYINPNIREENIRFFNERFNKKENVFLGAIAIGFYDTKEKRTLKKKSLKEL